MARNFLLDTSVLLAAVLDPDRLPEKIQRILVDPQNSVWFSAASIWEIAIKTSLARADFDFRPEDIHALALGSPFSELPVEAAHTYAVATLPWHHKDPFDRLLVAQAMTLPAYLLTTDQSLGQYSPLVQTLSWNP